MKYDHENLELCPECRRWIAGGCKQHSIPSPSTIELELRICHMMLDQADIPKEPALHDKLALLVAMFHDVDGGG